MRFLKRVLERLNGTTERHFRADDESEYYALLRSMGETIDRYDEF